MTKTIGIIGGTGPHGRGLALRLAHAGHNVLVGSRSTQRAAETVEKFGEVTATVRGCENDEAAAEGDLVLLTLPYEAQAGALPGLRAHLAGKIVVSCANPLAFDANGPYPLVSDAGSAAEEAAQLLTGARVVGAFQNVSAVLLRRLDERLEGDVLLCGDDGGAKDAVAEIVEQIPDLRPVDAGALRLSGAVEAMTAVLLSINKRYSTHAGLHVTGVSPSGKRDG